VTAVSVRAERGPPGCVTHWAALHRAALDQEIAGMQAAAQVNQLNQKIQSQDWTRDINYRDQATGLCPSCGQESGGGKFCQGCGHALAAAQAAQKFCGNCGTPLSGARFCGECGTPAL
jgi:membrane protease subunit (stomatin/prohibitin family)